MGQIEVFDMNIRREVDGTIIKVVSPMLESLMKSWSTGIQELVPREEFVASSVEILEPAAPRFALYQVQNDQIIGVVRNAGIDARLDWNFLHTIYDRSKLYLQYLCAVGLGSGVTYKFKFPYSKSMITRLRDAVRTTVKCVLEEFAQPVEARLTLTREDGVSED